MQSPVVIVGYLALFASVGFLFLFVNLLVGRFVRPQLPNAEKLEVYECGEPTIGSSFVQFDLRFYVVALLFIIFDVEVAFFFPWATVFGKGVQLMDPRLDKVVASAPDTLAPDASRIFQELGVARPVVPALSAQAAAALPAEATDAERNARAVTDWARDLIRFSIIDIAAFFAVLMIGFAYVWRRGDLDWVRAVSQERQDDYERKAATTELEPALAR